MRDLSRRSIVTGAAAAIPVAALAAVPALASLPDAKLISLGREIEAFLPRYIPVVLRSCYLGWEAHELAKERSGLREKQNQGVKLAAEDFERLHAEWELVARKTGADEAEKEYSRMSWEEDRLVNAVAALTAQTDEGLRVKALAVALANIHSFTRPPSALEWHEKVARGLLESFIGVLGIKIDDDLIQRDDDPAA